MRYLTMAGLLILALAVSAFGQIIDPNVGFCAAPATASTCTTATGPGGETILINSSTTFGMWSNGAPDANAPWYLIIAMPEVTDGAIDAAFSTPPTLTSTSFNSGNPVTPTTDGTGADFTSGDIYSYVDTLKGITLNGDNSESFSNMSAADKTLLGSTPNDFEVFVYSFSPGFNGATAYQFTSSAALPNGTFLAALAVGGSNNNTQFSTPFTTTGLVDAVPDGGMTLMLLGGALVGLETLRRKFSV